MEISLRQIPNVYSYKREYLNLHSREINTLILGNSYSYHGIDPRFFSMNTFNASYSMQPLIYDFEILKKYENNFDNLHTIIVPISYNSFYIKSARDIIKNYNYVVYYDLDVDHSFRDLFIVLNNSFKANLKSIFTYYIVRDNQLKCSILGWYPTEGPIDLIRSGQNNAEWHKTWSTNELKVFEANTSLLHSIISWSKNKNVKVILYTPPAFETYRKYVNDDQLSITIETAKRIANQYDNCSYYNFFENIEYTAKDYYDADHLNEIGAKKLSLMINEKISN